MIGRAVFLLANAAPLLMPVAATGPADTANPVRATAQAIRRGSFEQAIHFADAELAAHPGEKRLLTLRGIAQEKLKREADALHSFEQALTADPSYLPALRGAVEIKFRKNDTSAIPELDRLLSIDPSDQTAHAMRGVFAWRLKNCGLAAEHFSRADSVLDHQPQALKEYASCLIRLGREDEATRILQRARTLNPRDSRPACAIAALQISREQYREALATLEPFVKEPNIDVLSLLAQAYEGVGDTPNAVEKLRQAILLSPDRASLYVQFAWLSFEHKSFQVGIDMINAGLKRLPRSSDLYLARGILHVQKGEYEKADQDFARADLLNPHQATGSGAQALNALQSDHLDQAISVARSSLKTHPDDALSAYVLAEALLKNGAHPGSTEFAEARAAAQRAVRAKPDFIAAADVLSRIYLQSGETDAAIAECRRVLAINPDDETSLYRLVRALKKRGSESDLAEVPALLQRLSASRKRLQQREAQASRYRLIEP